MNRAPAPGEATLGQRLRAACRPLHDALDRQPVLASLATPAPRRDAYCRLLGAMAEVVPTLEHALRAALPPWWLGDWVAALNRADPLAADCAALGLTVTGALSPPQLDSRERCLAALYVLEGARLGSTLMARNLRRAGLGNALPLTFLETPTPAALGWPALLALLGRCRGDSVAATRACALATDVFQHLLDRLAATPASAGALA